MNPIDVKKVINFCDLDFQEVAKKLFPDNKYPASALTRVAENKALLDEQQVMALSKITGLPIDILFSSLWKASVTKKDDDSIVHVFKQKDYRAELDIETGQTRIFHKEVFLKDTLIHIVGISLKKYLAFLDETILELNR